MTWHLEFAAMRKEDARRAEIFVIREALREWPRATLTELELYGELNIEVLRERIPELIEAGIVEETESRMCRATRRRRQRTYQMTKEEDEG